MDEKNNKPNSGINEFDGKAFEKNVRHSFDLIKKFKHLNIFTFVDKKSLQLSRLIEKKRSNKSSGILVGRILSIKR
ncbi:MAG: hypothetical protein K9J16_13560 [Melioribacteraceae bacterium]|nr:hypothetical protein [Melioribacteraceae bacterium]MCF8355447.1 hypothetical protein [Melioribacteraceae bacterium]MCF8395382.1 hypothetical protein [Melioribacteraceae bacterium]